MRLFASDVVQHVPGDGPMAGTYKGPEAVLGYYGKLSEMTDGPSARTSSTCTATGSATSPRCTGRSPSATV